MKNLFTALALFVISTGWSQTKNEIPRSEFTINLSESSLSIRPGESKTLTVLIARSKSFAKGITELGFSSALPTGITVTYAPVSGNFESSMATITADPAASSGSYNLVLNGTIYHKTKGSILKLLVTNDNIVAK